MCKTNQTSHHLVTEILNLMVSVLEMPFNEIVAPKVSVPADFGIERLGNPRHSNLVFNLKDGQKVQTNSVIVSLNSPVVDHLISDLCVTSIDVDDFKNDAAHCFLEGCYTGRLQKINKDIFRDVNKMAHVFKVEWMEKRCAEYFHYLTENIPEVFTFQDLVFLFEEACYAEKRFTNESFLDIVTSKISSSASYRKCFVKQYLTEKAGNIDDRKLKAILKIAHRQPEMLVSFIIDQLKLDKSTLSGEARYFLRNVNFSRCFRKYPDLQKKLIEYLGLIESPSPEDYKLVLSLYKSCNTVIEKYSSIPNLFNEFKTMSEFPTFDELLTFLGSSQGVISFNMFFEGMFCWLFNRANSSTKLPINFEDRIQSIRVEKGWKNISSHLVKMLVVDGERYPVFQSFENAIRKCQAVSSHEYKYVTSITDYGWKDLLFKENNIEFLINKTELNPIVGPCPESGECGLVIHVTPCTEENNSSFNIQLLQDPLQYPNHIHFHEDIISSKNMHFVLEMTFSGNKRLFPVSWYGKPNCNIDGSIWKWGAIYFMDKGETPLGFPDENIDWRWGLGRQAKITPALLISSD